MNFFLPLRIVQAILSLIVLGLSAHVADYWGGAYHRSSPSEVNFLVFTSIWSLLVLIYLIVAPWKFERLAAPLYIVIVEALTCLFWFAGFIAAAVFLGNRRSCYGLVCGSFKAAVVFAAFTWATFTATTTLAALGVMKSRGSHGSKADPNVMAA